MPPKRWSIEFLSDCCEAWSKNLQKTPSGKPRSPRSDRPCFNFSRLSSMTIRAGDTVKEIFGRHFLFTGYQHREGLNASPGRHGDVGTKKEGIGRPISIVFSSVVSPYLASSRHLQLRPHVPMSTRHILAGTFPPLLRLVCKRENEISSSEHYSTF